MIRRIAGVLLSVLAWAGPAHATDQRPDLIQIDGQQATLLAEPLAGPLDDPATWKRFVAHAGSALGSCSANWRGYRADWRLDGQRLLLDRGGLGTCNDAPPTLPMDVLFPGQASPVPAVWVGGELIVELPATATTAAPAPATYVLLRLRRGHVVSRETLTEKMLRARRNATASPPPVP
ncbi:hypothetical protein [Xanthomonas oryzae]|uniref:Putative secreted protein n=1 Tax=Xanthomonas oryzae pv. oryzicola (strain BLS256) TaxID=383407 RepID=G7TKH2_XANOB|nr:hypothetical protein [Xanthomonas oryzae]AEQ98311.1 putative secreted protein [Xanthomonas oryzae pv. oryzicola BLS256]AKO21334.1 hypothetical protein ACU11_19695 [Xanthomonas oryzae pv. oryzicola]PUE91270.1 hypothetical protein C7T79_18105 [Xanthomonas oryzae pv. oryzicola]WVN06381.1 hypothetical protein V1208_19875 [Xanthomonas oryzae pv. oryzicola]